MKQWFLGAVAALAVVLMAASCAQAVVVTVTPENMQGWSVEVNKGGPYDEAYFGKAGSGEITNAGAAVWEQAEPFMAPDMTNLGSGAFYATVNYAGVEDNSKTPCSVWLGLDTWNGQPLAGITLNRITEMKYYAYVAKIPIHQVPYHSDWDYVPYWTYPRHPVSLQLTVENPNNPSDRRQFWYMPWYPLTSGHTIRGERSGMNAKRWILYNCMGGYDPEQPYIKHRWYLYRDDINQERVYESWSELIAEYGTWKLVPTSTNAWPAGWKSSGWDNTTSPPGEETCTATGKCLNFEVGARKSRARLFLETSEINWYADFCGFRGYIDMFTLGIDGTSITYNFEPSPTLPQPKVLARPTSVQAHLIQREPFARNYYMTKVAGSVPQIDTTNLLWFALDDGYRPPGASSLLPKDYLVRVYTMNEVAPAYDGECWSAWGLLEKPRFYGYHKTQNHPMPYCLWTTSSHCTYLGMFE